MVKGIEKIGDLLGGKSISTTMEYVRFFGLPAKKNSQAVWELDVEKFKSWAASLGWTRQMSESEIRVQVRKKALLEAGPGKVVEAKSLDALAKKLFSDVGRIQSYMRQSDCPIEKQTDNTFKVDLHKWELFQIEHRIGEYLLTGKKSRGRLAWN